MADDEGVIIWAVVYSNYEPPEVVALYTNEAAAREHVEDSEDPLRAVPWSVRTRYAVAAVPEAPKDPGELNR